MRKPFSQGHLAAAIAAVSCAAPLSHYASAAIITLSNTTGGTVTSISSPTWTPANLVTIGTTADAFVFGNEGQVVEAGVTFAAYAASRGNISVSFDQGGGPNYYGNLACTAASGTTADPGLVTIAQNLVINATSTKPEAIITTFSGLSANTTYEVDQIIAVNSRVEAVTYNNSTYVGNATDSITTVGAGSSSNPNYVYQFQDDVTSTGSGTLTVYTWGGAGGASDVAANAIALFTTVPEPSSMALLGLGTAALVMRRRRFRTTHAALGQRGNSSNA